MFRTTLLIMAGWLIAATAWAAVVPVPTSTIERLNYFTYHHGYGQVLVVKPTNSFACGPNNHTDFALDVSNGRNQAAAAALEAALLSNRGVYLEIDSSNTTLANGRCAIMLVQAK